MILVDTSVWADHFRVADLTLIRWLDRAEVLMHPFVFGELVVGNLPARARTIDSLNKLATLPVAAHADVVSLLETEHLYGLGLSWVDLHLLVSAQAHRVHVWTRDRRLAALLDRFGLQHVEAVA